MKTDREVRIWEEPVRGAYPDQRIFFGLNGVDQIASFLDRRAPPPPISHLTGMHPTAVGDGTSEFGMPASEWLVSPAGWIQLGTLAILADGPLGCAVQTALPPATPYTTAEISMTAVRPVGPNAGRLLCKGRLIHAGRSLGLSEATIEDEGGRLVAHGTSRCFIFPPLAPPPDEPPRLERVEPPAYDTPNPYEREPAGSVVPQEVWDRSSGLEVMEGLIAGQLPSPPIHHLTGLRPTEAAEGSSTFVMPATEWLCSPLRRLEGGTIAMLAETALIAAVQTTCRPRMSFAPFDLKVNFLRPIDPDGRDLIARGTVIHRGRSLAVATSEVVTESGRRLAVAIGTSMILTGRPWHRPVVAEEEAPAEPLD
ncbi:MAG TPA: PaaI family thioesterase [Actinomycetota bacterium]|nr:PaaI family thioesterase [Actinomycetota bacterium]